MTIQEIVLQLATNISQLNQLLELYKHPAMPAECKASLLTLGKALAHEVHDLAEALETATRDIGPA